MGSNTAIVVSGPMPGSTPMRVPTKQPTRHSRMFCQEKATEKPTARWPMKSTIGRPRSAGPHPGPGSGNKRRDPGVGQVHDPQRGGSAERLGRNRLQCAGDDRKVHAEQVVEQCEAECGEAEAGGTEVP